MKNVKLLDCTLRDGGRIINCAFPDREIKEMAKGLDDAGIDIIEIGFLRDEASVDYRGDSTFFTAPKQIEPLIPDGGKALYVAFIDYGMYNFSKLPDCNGKAIGGIRFGFTKQNYREQKKEVLSCIDITKRKGYRLFLQGVNTLNYSDKEIIELAELANEVKPYSFGIVDTYGAMYLDDAERIYSLVENNLDPEICLDFHSHNNYQLSFALAQTIIKQSRGVRQIIIDATLGGMGKMAGNLNLELIANYLVKRLHYNYDMDRLMDILDDYIVKYSYEHKWGYSVPAMMAGVYKSHPNNVIYLTEKYRIGTKDVGNILSMIEPTKRQRYDYDNIERLYINYQSENIDDTETIEQIRKKTDGKKILMLVPGSSLNVCHNEIEKYIREENPFLISVNFMPHYEGMAFFGNEKQYVRVQSAEEKERCIISSNIKTNDSVLKINYQSLLNRGYRFFDNSAMMCLNLLKRLGAQDIMIAGFDGFQKGGGNYKNDSFQEIRHADSYDEENRELKSMLRDYMEEKPESVRVRMLTPGLFTDMVNRYSE